MPTTNFYPANPSCVIFVCLREWVESGDVEAAQNLLKPLIESDKSIKEFAGSLTLIFPDYTEDPREVWMIPEIRTWFRRLTEVFPYWFVLLSRTDDSLSVAMSILIDGQEVKNEGRIGWGIRPESLKKCMFMLFDGMNNLLEEHGMPEELNERYTAEITEALVSFLGA